jgi:hypothetical protein
MMDFYDGKTCVLTHNRLAVHWAHMLDAALLTSNQRVRHTFHLQLSSMLTLKLQLISFDGHLRQDKHPSHAAEIRENVIPCMSF